MTNVDVTNKISSNKGSFSCPECGSPDVLMDIDFQVSGVAPLAFDPPCLDLDEVTTTGFWEFELLCQECDWYQSYREDEVEWC